MFTTSEAYNSKTAVNLGNRTSGPILINLPRHWRKEFQMKYCQIQFICFCVISSTLEEDYWDTRTV